MNEDTSKAERLHDYRTKVALLEKENAELVDLLDEYKSAVSNALYRNSFSCLLDIGGQSNE